MKQDFRSNPWIKALALLLTLSCALGAALSWLYCGLHWDSLFGGADYTTSRLYRTARYEKYHSLCSFVDAGLRLREGARLNYLEQKEHDNTVAALDPQTTNFRFIVRDNTTGEILWSSGGPDSLSGVAAVSTDLRTYTKNEAGTWVYGYRAPTVEYDSHGRVIHYQQSSGTNHYYQYNDQGQLVNYWNDNGAQYIFSYSDDGSVYVRDAESYLEMDSVSPSLYPPDMVLPQVGESQPEQLQLAVEYGVESSLSVTDEFSQARDSFQAGRMEYFYLAITLTALVLVGTIFLMCCAGRRRGAETFTRNWQDRIPYDLYLIILFVLFYFGLSLLEQLLWGISSIYGAEMEMASYTAHLGTLIAFCAGTVVALAALGEALLLTTATRVKTNTLPQNTVVWWCLKWLGRGCRALGREAKALFESWTTTRRAVLCFLAYLLGTAVTTPTVVLIPFYQGFVLYLVCRWVKEWRLIRSGTQAIVGGAPDTIIDTSRMKWFPDLVQHAEQLNDLGTAINSAVEERMKSERMKGELITNVSHDLKTPLTSIINYVDLLKKEEIENETAREYIEVLDRKSQRLKKLTEDLVEASKASTGTLAVNREKLGVAQLVTQALGEYSEKLSAAGLTVVPTLTEEEVYVQADGRHLWRILDNLMNNCVKYAMPGTRVYLDLMAQDGYVTLSLKNISATQLNIPADQLLERFVRGDESRTTEGSGLGLSIARSLTELQGGAFRLEVDGDLFKAVVTFPQVK